MKCVKYSNEKNELINAMHVMLNQPDNPIAINRKSINTNGIIRHSISSQKS